jgi:hypothetical protein
LDCSDVFPCLANKASKNRLKKGKAITPSTQNRNGRSPRSNGLSSNQPVSQSQLNEQSANVTTMARPGESVEDRTIKLRDPPFLPTSEQVTEQSKDESAENTSRHSFSMPSLTLKSNKVSPAECVPAAITNDTR